MVPFIGMIFGYLQIGGEKNPPLTFKPIATVFSPQAENE
jgi:hypothetical protein